MFLHTKDLVLRSLRHYLQEQNHRCQIITHLGGGGEEERHEQLICFDSLKGQCLLLHPCHFITVMYSMIILTPSLPQPVKFPGWKMHGCACKQCIFWSYNTSTFNAMRFDENLFTCQCGRKKKAYGFQISHFSWSFSSDIRAVKGLKEYHNDALDHIKGEPMQTSKPDQKMCKYFHLQASLCCAVSIYTKVLGGFTWEFVFLGKKPCCFILYQCRAEKGWLVMHFTGYFCHMLQPCLCYR